MFNALGTSLSVLRIRVMLIIVQSTGQFVLGVIGRESPHSHRKAASEDESDFDRSLRACTCEITNLYSDACS